MGRPVPTARPSPPPQAGSDTRPPADEPATTSPDRLDTGLFGIVDKRRAPKQEPSFELWLPPSLQGQRADYTRRIDGAINHTIEWFRQQGFTLSKGQMIQRALVFDNRATALQVLAREFHQRPEELAPIMDAFSGTVQNGTLYLVAPQLYQKTWEKMYPQCPWDEVAYQGLIRHELTHRAHSLVSQALVGSDAAMGPRWWFEGLANVAAGLFPLGSPGQVPMSRAEVAARVRDPKAVPDDYPLYARLVASLGRFYSYKTLIEQAAQPGFPASLRGMSFE